MLHAAGTIVGDMVRDLNLEAFSRLIAINVTRLMICLREAART